MTKIDLAIWSKGKEKPKWALGDSYQLDVSITSANKQLMQWAQDSEADYILLWSERRDLPTDVLLINLAEQGIDIAHAGIRLGLGYAWPDLHMVLQSWHMLNGSEGVPTSSWRVSVDACLIRRELFLVSGGFDQAFHSISGAGLEFGYRCLQNGALVEYRPELLEQTSGNLSSAPPTQDMYIFMLRHCGLQWSRYVWLRRGWRPWKWLAEWQFLRKATKRHRETAAPLAQAQPVWYDPPIPSLDVIINTPVTVIIPTLGRYPYLPQALDSLRQQTVRPQEVIVVDQNPPEQRQPETYVGYEDLTLQVIWQDERGQSLARNTGLAAATSTYVFLFDDDSIADPDLIAAHLRLVLSGRCHVSTGVAFPPPPSAYQLPPHYRHTRLAQTFDTGNSLLPLELARKMGGLDRNYDFGPGTDSDFGTRLYLAGYRIAHNPQARRIHFKAPMGGLRTHGARKYNTDAGLWQPFPPPTLSYYGLRYLTRQQQRERTFISFIASKIQPDVRKNRRAVWSLFIAIVSLGVSILFLPWKWRASLRHARLLLDKGVCLATFPVSDEAA